MKLYSFWNFQNNAGRGKRVRCNKMGRMSVIVKARWWVHAGLLYFVCTIFFCYVLFKIKVPLTYNLMMVSHKQHSGFSIHPHYQVFTPSIEVTAY